MSDPSQQKSPFSGFGGLGGSGQGQSSSLFGTPSPQNASSSTSQTPKPSLFGGVSSGTTPAPSSGSSLFGGGSASGGGFGALGNTGQQSSSSLFGGASTPSKPNNPSSTAQETPKPAFNLQNTMSTTPAGPPPTGLSSGLFGNTGSSSPFGAPAAKSGDDKTQTAPPSSSSGLGLFGSKPQTQPQSQPQANAAPSLFGSTPSTSANNSSAAGQSTSLFGKPAAQTTGASQPSSSPSLFGTASKPTAPQNSSSGLFGGAPASTSQATTTSLFGNANSSSTAPQTSLFGQNKAPNSSAAANEGQKDTSQTRPQQDAAPKPSLFSAPTSSSKGPSLFGTAPATGQASDQSPKDSSKPATAATSGDGKSSASLFGGAAPATGATSSLFSTQSQSKTGQASTETAQSSSTKPSSLFPAAPTTTAGSGPSLFGGASTQTTAEPQTKTSDPKPPTAPESKETSVSASSSNAAAAASTTATAAANLSSSTAGPAPTPQSRLKNKSMDDIITRWGSDLAKYQKEFQQQAEKIAAWDRMLVENSSAIAKLYSKTFQAERDTAEVQKQLTTVEDNQEELSMWLDQYERDVDELMARQVGQDGTLQGPDQERERAYKTADKVSERLTEMGKDLSSMIEEINNASATISKTTRADDPLTSIVRILNGHLSQLQSIDQGTTALQTKIAAAQKDSSRLGSSNGFGNDAADSFYQSYMKRN